MIPPALRVPARCFGCTSSGVGDLPHAGVGREDQLFVDRLASLLLKLPANFLKFPQADRGVGRISIRDTEVFLRFWIPEVNHTDVARIPPYRELTLAGGFFWVCGVHPSTQDIRVVSNLINEDAVRLHRSFQIRHEI